MKKATGGLPSHFPCYCVWRLLRKKSRPDDDDSSRSQSPIPSGEEENKNIHDQTECYTEKENEKIAEDKAGYGATENGPVKENEKIAEDKARYGATGDGPVQLVTPIEISSVSPMLHLLGSVHTHDFTDSTSVNTTDYGASTRVESEVGASSVPVIVQPASPTEPISPFAQLIGSLHPIDTESSTVEVDNHGSFSSDYKSNSVSLPDEIETASPQSTATTDITEQAKQKKKLKLPKKFHFPKKKTRQKRRAPKMLKAGINSLSKSLPSLVWDNASTVSSCSTSRFSTSALLAPMDDLSDDEICRE